MSGIIKALPKEISDKIAAGEVVERPLSIVKELVENSIDAGAASITVEIRKGGKEYIRISDDGKGMSSEDAELCFHRYATSKISEAEDLFAVSSLGFRGEALASIAAVSRIELITKQTGERIGTKVVISGGIIDEKSETACRDGTTIVVRDLFYNTPARRKFLRPDNAESSLVIDFLSKIAIAYPKIRVRLISNGSILFSTLGKGDLKQAIQTVYSPDLVRKLLPVNYSLNDYTVRAYISAPSQSRTNRRYQIFFVNGRLVKSRLLEQAVSAAYSDKLFDGRYPAVFMFLELPADSLDVNIHPSKSEIKFYQEDHVKEFVIKALRRALLNPEAADLELADIRNAVPKELMSGKGFKAPDFSPTAPRNEDPRLREKLRKEAILAAQNAHKAPAAPAEVKEAPNALKELLEKAKQAKPSVPVQPAEASPVQEKPAPGAVEENKTEKGYSSVVISGEKKEELFAKLRSEREAKASEPAKPIEFTVQEELFPEITKAAQKKQFAFAELKYVGQVFDTYLICKSNEHLYLVDQHAAHERIMYEELLARFERGSSDSQLLMMPLILHMSPAEKEASLDKLSELARLGYVIDDFGPGELAVKEVPSSMSPEQAETFISGLFENGALGAVKGDLMKSEIIMSSCKAAVKAGDRLSDMEITELFRRLDQCENPFSCPHGRPTFIRLSQYELEKLFKRK